MSATTGRKEAGFSVEMTDGKLPREKMHKESAGKAVEAGLISACEARVYLAVSERLFEVLETELSLSTMDDFDANQIAKGFQLAISGAIVSLGWSLAHESHGDAGRQLLTGLICVEIASLVKTFSNEAAGGAAAGVFMHKGSVSTVSRGNGKPQ